MSTYDSWKQRDLAGEEDDKRPLFIECDHGVGIGPCPVCHGQAACYDDAKLTELDAITGLRDGTIIR